MFRKGAAVCVWEAGHRGDRHWQQVGQDGQTGYFPFQNPWVNRGYCVAGIPAALTIPGELGFTNPRDRGCWRVFGSRHLTIFACFLLGAASRSRGPSYFQLFGCWVACS